MPEFHPTTSQITELLTQSGSWFETFTHQPVLTSKEAVKTRPGYTLQQGAKALIARVKPRGQEKTFMMLVVSAADQFDTKLTKQQLDLKEIRFATPEEVAEITGGILPGGVPPFGNLFGLRVVVDPGLVVNEKIVFNAGDRRFSVAMKASDYIKLVKPEIVKIVAT